MLDPSSPAVKTPSSKAVPSTLQPPHYQQSTHNTHHKSLLLTHLKELPGTGHGHNVHALLARLQVELEAQPDVGIVWHFPCRAVDNCLQLCQTLTVGAEIFHVVCLPAADFLFFETSDRKIQLPKKKPKNPKQAEVNWFGHVIIACKQFAKELAHLL